MYGFQGQMQYAGAFGAGAAMGGPSMFPQQNNNPQLNQFNSGKNPQLSQFNSGKPQQPQYQVGRPQQPPVQMQKFQSAPAPGPRGAQPMGMAAAPAQQKAVGGIFGNQQQQRQYEQQILQMGNDILQSLNAEDVITDVTTFQYDVFYIQIFQEIIPDLNFGQMQPGQTADEMAANIDAILDFIEKMVPEIDIQILNGDMIVQGDLQQIQMMLELIQELILMTVEEGEDQLGDQDQMNQADQIVKQQLMLQQQAAQEAQMKLIQEEQMRKAYQPQQPMNYGKPVNQNMSLNDSDLQEEPSKPKVDQKKERGFRARLNQHIDEGASKTDKEIEELK